MMAKKRILALAAVGLMVAAAGVAVAANFGSGKQTDFFASGKHRFYVWCAGGSDYSAVQTGRSAEDAQMKLYNAAKASGHSACWPVWQGRIPS